MNKFLSALALATVLSLLFLSSCATEDAVVEKQTDFMNVSQAEYYFNNNSIALKKNAYFLGNPDWKEGVFRNDTLTVPLSSEKPIFVKNVDKDKKPGYLKSYLLVTKNKMDNTFEYKLKVSFSADIKALTVNRYHVYSEEDVWISDNGKKPALKNTKRSNTGRMRCEHWGLFYVNPESGQDRLIHDWWECSGSDAGGEEAPPNGGGGGEGDGTSLTDAEVIEDYIYDTDLDPCPKEALTQLKNASNCDIANMLTKLGTNSIYTLNIVSGVPKDGSPAITTRTDPKVRFNYTTTINENYEDATSLFRASNILHELAHAFFMSLKDDKDTGGGSTVYGEFPALFQVYCDSKYPPNKTEAANAHHEEMANKYVDAIASSLQEYNRSNDPKGLVSYQVYSDLAWAGLMDAPVFNEHFKGKEVEKKRIRDRYGCESNGGTIGAGTPQQQMAVGKPCTK
jgi:hypothetical protein